MISLPADVLEIHVLSICMAARVLSDIAREAGTTETSLDGEVIASLFHAALCLKEETTPDDLKDVLNLFGNCYAEAMRRYKAEKAAPSTSCDRNDKDPDEVSYCNGCDRPIPPGQMSLW